MSPLKYFIFFIAIFVIFLLYNADCVLAQNKFILSIAKNLHNNGKINFNPPGWDCDVGCANAIPPPYNYNTSVILTATPAPGYVFTNWSGDCSGNNSVCVLTMNVDKSVVANFSPQINNQATASTTPSLSPLQATNTTRQDSATTAIQSLQPKKYSLFALIIIVGIPSFFVLFALFWFWQSRRYRD